MIDRRKFLKSSLFGVGAGAGFASNLAALNAYAADVSDYKALVCIFLVGGMDCHDTIIPYDSESYDQYSSLRAPLIAAYDKEGVSRQRHRLHKISADLRGRSFAMPSELSSLHQLFEQGNAAVVGNVGPLIETINRESFLNNSARRPPKLGSHNDQQSIWMTSRPEGATVGWGGRFGDMMDAAQANSHASFTTVSVSGNSVFVNGQHVRPSIVSPDGAVKVREVNRNTVFGATFQQMLRDSGATRSNPFERDMVSIANASLDNNAVLAEQLALSGDPMTIYPDGKLSERLRIVSRLIARRDSLGMKRQIFFVPMSGFDTHSDQAVRLSELQAELDSSIRAFYDSMVELGTDNSVTTFTASDFGRTLSVNGDGTDHGWGGHHLVVGGAVNGGKIYGDIPPPEFGHDQDYGRGRLIPQISVDQYAGALGRWFGLSHSEVREAMPNLHRFDPSALAELFV